MLKRVLLFFFFTASFSSFSQETCLSKKVSLEVNEQPLSVALRMIEQQTGCNFTFNSKIINKNKLVSIHLSNKTVEYALQKILSDPSLSFNCINSLIIINQQKTTVKEKKVIVPPKKMYDTVLVYNNIYDTVTVTNNIYDTLRSVINDTNRVIIYDTINIINEQPPKNKKEVVKENKTKTDSKYSIGLSVASGIHQTVIAETQAAYKNTVNEIRSYLKTGKAYQFSAELHSARHKLYPSVGIQFRYIQQSYQYSISETQTQIIENTELSPFDTIYYINIENKITIPQIYYDTITVSKEISADSVTEKTKTMREYVIAVPICFNARFAVNKKLSLSLSAGGVFNAYFNSSKQFPLIKTWYKYSYQDKPEIVDSYILPETEAAKRYTVSILNRLNLYYSVNTNNMIKLGILANWSITNRYKGGEYRARERAFSASLGWLIKL